ncbi:4-hydroxybenzoate polyprenyltransferase [Kordia periserrulae]|uniref:4-hydroxybenzoate polyprenyltransferase n=1 Tax=Kordia periserrulae TaxID=701523 RepID=A0A2T6C1M7_9FLAO|nr:geranylgeranylglycerol-phosphate geranylgeranyltransferase [Kordia periserrulae]PTX62211.1 4-hydroxybenzoate polyprenyltransferase [Kordia periserrulae]
MSKFLQLVRFPNLVMIALTQFLFYVYWIAPFDDSYISSKLFIFVVLATVFIAAGGNIINDIFDVQTDRINKPHKLFIGTHISKKSAYFYYFLFTFVGIGLGSYVGFVIGKSWISLVFVGISALLFLYSSHVKGIPVLGNVLVSLLVSSSLLILIVFDTEPTMRGKHLNLFNAFSLVAIYVYASFAFLMNLTREIVKDIEDINGDFNANITTLPIVLGRNRVNKIVAALAGITILFTLYCISEYLQGQTVITIYILLTILLPLLYFIVKIWQADTKREYQVLSLLLKLIMLFGILSTVVYYYFIELETFQYILF